MQSFTPYTLVLASQSPRRKELLEKAGFLFTVSPVQISEIPDKNLNLNEQIRDLARQKARALVESGKTLKGQKNLVLSADTLVILDDEVLGKPKHLQESEQFLRQLSGQTHRVTTGICLWDVDESRVAVDHQTTYVTFRQLREDELMTYVLSGDGLDKAGAYGIQGEAGNFVEKVEGPMDNVVGLPVSLVEKLLRENDWPVKRKNA